MPLSGEIVDISRGRLSGAPRSSWVMNRSQPNPAVVIVSSTRTRQARRGPLSGCCRVLHRVAGSGRNVNLF